MRKIRRQILRRRKQQIERRLQPQNWSDQEQPMLEASNLQYELSDRTLGLDCGGIGAIHRMVRHVGLDEAINEHVQVLKAHLPYWESDHVLHFAYNVLAGGTCMEDMQLRRLNEGYMDALGARVIPAPTTAGDFLRRFGRLDIESLMSAVNEVRLRVWAKQPREFFKEATIDVDGTMAPTTGECKQGMDISHKGEWGYHPLVVTLAQTGEVLYTVNRSGNRPSHEGAALRLDQAKVLCRRAGFRQVTFRGDTDYSQCEHLDGWDTDGVRFVFGFDANRKLVGLADSLAERVWRPLKRRARYEVQTERRQRPERVKEAVVIERDFNNIRLQSEQVAEFDYQPSACAKSYRMVVVRKNLTVMKGERRLFDEVRYLFYITNDRESTKTAIVYEANERCNQENVIEQLHNGVRALKAPSNTLLSNWAYMVAVSLAWTLKAWFALLLPEGGRWSAKHRAEKRTVLKMEFKAFLNAFMRVPAQVLRTGHRIVLRLLSWNPWQGVFLRAVDHFHGRLTC